MTMIIDGTNGLTFNNSTTQASAGSVLQVVNASTTGTASTTSNSFTDTGLSATITPKFSTSKILVLVSQNGNLGGAGGSIRFQLLRNSSVLTIYESIHCYGYSATQVGAGTSGIEYLDSPATTSATTYKIQFSQRNSGTTCIAQYSDGGGIDSRSTITLMEIAA